MQWTEPAGKLLVVECRRGAGSATDRHYVIPPMNTVPDIESTPREVRWSDVADFDQLDERVSAVTNIFGSVIGVNDGYIEWCPDDIPPTEQERLAWIWLCNPALDAEILPRAKGWFRDLVVAYRAGEMRRWWDEGGRPALG